MISKTWCAKYVLWILIRNSTQRLQSNVTLPPSRDCMSCIRLPWSYPRPTGPEAELSWGVGSGGGGEPGNLNSKRSPAESARGPKLVPAASKHFQSSCEDLAVFPPQSPLHLSAPAQDGGTSSQPVGHLRPAKSPGLLLPRQPQAELETRHIGSRLISKLVILFGL